MNLRTERGQWSLGKKLVNEYLLLQVKEFFVKK